MDNKLHVLTGCEGLDGKELADSFVLQKIRDLGLNKFAGILDGLGAASALDDVDATIFAPTDEALNSFLTTFSFDNLDKLVEESDMASTIVGYHFVGGPAKNASQFLHGSALDTLIKNFSSCGHDTLIFSVQDHELGIEAGGSRATIVNPDNTVGSAIIHVVDSVLVPCGLKCETESAKNGYDQLISPMSSLNQADLLSSLNKIPSDEEITIVQPSGALLVKLLEGEIHTHVASDIDLLLGMLTMNHVSIGPAILSVSAIDFQDSSQKSVEVMECKVDSVTASVGESVAVARQDDFKQRNALTVIGGGENSSASFTGVNSCTNTVHAWDISVVFSPPTLVEMLEALVGRGKEKHCTSFLEFLRTSPQYSIVASMVQSLDGVDVGNGGTFFVPDNTAMGRAIFEHDIQLENLTDTSQLEAILDYHKAQKLLLPADFVEGAKIETDLGVNNVLAVR